MQMSKVNREKGYCGYKFALLLLLCRCRINRVRMDESPIRKEKKGLQDMVRRGIRTAANSKNHVWDVMTRVPLRLSRRSLAFYYGKVPSFTYSSLREYKPAVYFSF